MEILPEEILEKILSSVPTKTLLNSARLVSNRWKMTATSICRLRSVELAEINRGEEKTVFTVFSDSVDLPWSSFTFIDSQACQTPVHSKTLFLETFGGQLRKLILETETYDIILNVLKFTTNLRSLKMKCPKGECTVKEDLKIDLPLLASLKMEITDESAEFFHFLIRSCRAPLVKVKLRIDVMLSVGIAVKLSPHLSSIPNIFLKVYLRNDIEPVALSVFAADKLKLRKLYLTFEGPDRKLAPSYFAPIETILTNSADTLRSLKILCQYGYGEGTCKTPLIFPTLPALKVLKVEFDGISYDDRPRFIESFFSVVTSHHFPTLDKVKLHMDVDQDPIPFRFEPTLFYRRKKIDRCRFPTVKELDLNSSCIMDDWPNLFPGLKRLKATVENCRFLRLVLGKMTQLEHLDLSFNVEEHLGDDVEVDLNMELSGVDPDEEENRCWTLQEEEEKSGYQFGPSACTTPVECQGLRRRRPNILSLSALKTLELTCEDDGRTRLDDAGVDLALISLHPLEKLCLRNQNISEEGKTRLIARHHRVEFHDD